jgi:hypothetical protein
MIDAETTRRFAAHLWQRLDAGLWDCTVVCLLGVPCAVAVAVWCPIGPDMTPAEHLAASAGLFVVWVGVPVFFTRIDPVARGRQTGGQRRAHISVILASGPGAPGYSRSFSSLLLSLLSLPLFIGSVIVELLSHDPTWRVTWYDRLTGLLVVMQDVRLMLNAGFCSDCGYDLRGAPMSGHCPECGRAFAPEDALRASELSRVLWPDHAKKEITDY